jgi:hypothetical protein
MQPKFFPGWLPLQKDKIIIVSGGVSRLKQ